MQKLLLAFLSLVGVFAFAPIVHGAIVQKQVNYLPVGDGSFDVQIHSTSTDDCVPVGQAATSSWVTYGITGGGGTFWSVPQLASASTTLRAFPVANTDFGALQQRCSVRIDNTNLLRWPYQNALLRIGFPLFHTGNPGVGELLDETFAGGGRSGTTATFCHQANDGSGCLVGNDGGGPTRMWLTFETPAAVNSTMTLKMPPANDCSGTDVDVYVVSRPMTGNETANWLQSTVGVTNWTTNGGDYNGGPVGTFTCSTSADVTTVLTLNSSQQSDFAANATLGFIIHSGESTPGNYAAWYAGSIFNGGGAHVQIGTIFPENDFNVLDWQIGDFFTSSTFSFTSSSLGLVPGTIDLCAGLVTTSTNVFTRLGADISQGFCSALSLVFVPSYNSVAKFASLGDEISTKFPFSYIASVQGSWDAVVVSSTANSPTWTINLGSVDPTTSTTWGPLLPSSFTFFSSSTVTGYFPPGLWNFLIHLGGVIVVSGAVWFIYKDAQTLPKKQ